MSHGLRNPVVDAVTGMITIVAGNGSSVSSGDGGEATSAGVLPARVGLDPAGTLFFSESWEPRIRRVGVRYVNQRPIANAGMDETVEVGATVILDGTGSTDPDGNPFFTPGGTASLTFAWTLAAWPLGGTATLAAPTASMTPFTPHRAGDYTIQLIVTDGWGQSSPPALVRISTQNSAPLAEAGPDQALVQIGTTVKLDGTNSYDPDGDPLTYAWSLQTPLGSRAKLSNASDPRPTFDPDLSGDYIANLVVYDSFGAQGDADTVWVTSSNVPPVADAGDNQAVLAGDTVYLDGSLSADANKHSLTYSWSLVSKPDDDDREVILDNPTAVQPSFIARQPGMYIVSLVVDDRFVMSRPSNVTIVATATDTPAIQVLRQAISTINGLDPSVFENPRMQKTFTNKINATILDLDQGLNQQALDQLKDDILAKTDGCALQPMPDEDDWMIDCAAQAEVYPLITQAIDLVKGLL